MLGKKGKLGAISDRIACDDVAVQTWEFTNKNIDRNCYNNSLDASKVRNIPALSCKEGGPLSTPQP